MFFNLLSAKEIKNLKKDIISRMLYGFTLFFVFWFIVFVIAFIAAFLYLDIQNTTTKNTIDSIRATEDARDLDELEDRVAELNNLIFRIEDVRASMPHDALEMIKVITPMIPEGARLTRFSFSSSSGTVFLEGRAERREQVTTLEDRLKEEEIFAQVEAPLSNILEPRNIDFTFSLLLSGAQEDNDE